MKKALPIIVYTLVLVLVTGMIASGATLLAVSAARVDQGDTVTISRDEYATLQKYTKISNIMTLIEAPQRSAEQCRACGRSLLQHRCQRH